MATSEQEGEHDPITAALPPNSDYITYLTMLEYQLTPDRIPILTRHLAEDDGTLAKEVGWDCVKLILPLLDAAPRDAAKCLEVVARRGNPREVVIRVAEALEMLGADDGANESESDQASGADDLPTFEGEAQRIHLGEMKLQGMSPPAARQRKSYDAPATQQQANVPAIPISSDLQFSTLLSVLGLLHPRIKTQYPSRFLATSLPAALGAYRRISITSETTTAFLALLGKLSGKQRPTLPPRSSTASATHLQPTATPGTQVYAPLPDPEGRAEENAIAPSDLERAIVLRLLQAVTLEVLEEYLLADASTMEWSTRLLEKQTPKKSIPDRRTRLKAWQDDENLKFKDNMMGNFLRLAEDLRIDPEDVFKRTNLPLVRDQVSGDIVADKSAEKDEDEEPSEFPTSPSQIPYSHLGALFIYLASRVPRILHLDENMPPLDIPMADLLHFVNQFVVPTPTLVTDQLLPSVAHNQPSAIDALLALLLTASAQNSTVARSATNAAGDYRSMIGILSYLSAEHSDPSFRASAHHLATNLLHTHPSSTFRLATIKSTMIDCGPFENLIEVAIGWLKEEILSTVLPASRRIVTSSVSGDEAEASSDNNIFASPALFSEDPILTSLLFPATTTPTPTSTPANPAPDQTEASSNPTAPPNPTHPTIPTIIPALNLLFLLLTNPTLKARCNLASQMTSAKTSSLSPSTSSATTTTATTRTTTTTEPSTFGARALHFLNCAREYVDEHAGLMGSKEEEGRLGLVGLAVGRVVGALEAYGREIGREKEKEVEREGESEGHEKEEGAAAASASASALKTLEMV
jgi:Uncharacterised protein family, YAP/Alf4/glomulin